jgi:hypothetical protein
MIRNIMKKEYGTDLKLFVNQADSGFPNERKYIISAKWWRKWCDYTGFEAITSDSCEEGELPKTLTAGNLH